VEDKGDMNVVAANTTIKIKTRQVIRMIPNPLNISSEVLRLHDIKSTRVDELNRELTL
jgi:hypothetical protein